MDYPFFNIIWNNVLKSMKNKKKKCEIMRYSAWKYGIHKTMGINGSFLHYLSIIGYMSIAKVDISNL
jgi:hypothetical protein